ncbi:hypothetical protein G1C95_0608 [Bifidobacterium sp. DSM 109957]|uniref:Uncharacterized protein n=2 Tax=Bifidobacterium oedipodis TaxID=2675322 RepID=A0A7Y0HSB6_9BIFI|nr:hypothetical protein [Bifidobacterium sp. DSM 109957]
MFAGMANIEVIDEFFGAISDGLSSYASLGTIVYNARKLELSMQVYEEAFKALSDYEIPEEPEVTDEEGHVSGKTFLKVLEWGGRRHNVAVIDGFLQEIVPLRESLRKEGVMFHSCTTRFQKLSDDQFNKYLNIIAKQNLYDRRQIVKPIYVKPSSPDEEQ